MQRVVIWWAKGPMGAGVRCGGAMRQRGSGRRILASDEEEEEEEEEEPEALAPVRWAPWWAYRPALGKGLAGSSSGGSSGAASAGSVRHVRSCGYSRSSHAASFQRASRPGTGSHAS